MTFARNIHYEELISRLLPARRSNPNTSQALETLVIVALKQPVSTGDINAIRDICMMPQSPFCLRSPQPRSRPLGSKGTARRGHALMTLSLAKIPIYRRIKYIDWTSILVL